MEAFYLIKIGEIQLKDGNRADFSDRLKYDIKKRLAGIHSDIHSREGRYYLKVPEEAAEKTEFVLSHTPGVNGWARARRLPKDMVAVRSGAIHVMQPLIEKGLRTFKVEARRSDKGFPLDSYAIASAVGSELLEHFPVLKVDVHKPQIVLRVEIREKAYVFIDGGTGVRGLPVGSGGKGLLLLSGGIDSPVAGYRMLSRGLALESLHFNSYPYTSTQAWEKVRDLAGVLACYSGGMVMHTAGFTDVQMKIKKDAKEEKATLYLRACMMMAADLLVKKRSLNSIVTGESLGQVASQTAENMRFTQSFTDQAVLRPLAGTDKEDTILTAKAIGSFEISILPYNDCCVLFAPKHPVLKARFREEKEEFQSLGFDSLVSEAVERIETITLPFSFTPPRAPSAHQR
jgi:thiamine biosynthesis protein ThiI